MLLYIDPMSMAMTARGIKGGVEFDTYYTLVGHDDCRFVVRKQGSKSLRIQVWQDGDLKQSVVVRKVSALAGRTEMGNSPIRLHVFELHPDRPIFPNAPLVGRLLRSGIYWWQITLMFDDDLEDCIPDFALPEMVSDGTVKSVLIPAETRAKEMRRLIVDGATWAIRFTGMEVARVFLWPNAVGATDAIFDAIRSIQSGEEDGV
jgi:hypothetical protein